LIEASELLKEKALCEYCNIALEDSIRILDFVKNILMSVFIKLNIEDINILLTMSLLLINICDLSRDYFAGQTLIKSEL
jgi:hypothetical protein